MDRVDAWCMHPERARLDVVEGGAGSLGEDGTGRPWLGVWFACANKYVRVFRKAEAKEYVARCPKCGDEVSFKVGTGGTNERFFEVRC